MLERIVAILLKDLLADGGKWVFEFIKGHLKKKKRNESVEDLKEARTDEEIDEALDNIINPK